MNVLHQPTVISEGEYQSVFFLNGMVAHMDHGYGFWFVLAILILLTAVIIYLGLNYEKLG